MRSNLALPSLLPTRLNSSLPFLYNSFAPETDERSALNPKVLEPLLYVRPTSSGPAIKSILSLPIGMVTLIGPSCLAISFATVFAAAFLIAPPAPGVLEEALSIDKSPSRSIINPLFFTSSSAAMSVLNSFPPLGSIICI